MGVVAKIGEITSKWGEKGTPGISQPLAVAKLQSAPGADNSHYAAAYLTRPSRQPISL